MVEVKFDIPDIDHLARDHHMSVRIGEVQKLGKLSSTARAFKFPAAAVGTRRYGKVEIYKRVGAGTFCIDPAVASGVNTVNLTLGDDSLCLGVQVCPDSSVAKREKQRSVPKASQAALDYIARHHLEVRLADAMQVVLRDRPADPAATLAEVLMQNAESVSKLPRPATPGVPPGLFVGAAERRPSETTKLPIAHEDPEVAKAAMPQPLQRTPDILPFAEYYKAHFRSVHQPLAKTGPTATDDLVCTGLQDGTSDSTRAPAKAAMPQPLQREPDILPFAEYYRAHFRSVHHPLAEQSSYDKFTFAKTGPTATDDLVCTGLLRGPSQREGPSQADQCGDAMSKEISLRRHATTVLDEGEADQCGDAMSKEISLRRHATTILDEGEASQSPDLEQLDGTSEATSAASAALTRQTGCRHLQAPQPPEA